MIDSQDEHVRKNPFAKPSASSRVSWRRKTDRVRISVFMTVVPENPFTPQPYDEERVMAQFVQNNTVSFKDNIVTKLLV